MLKTYSMPDVAYVGQVADINAHCLLCLGAVKAISDGHSVVEPVTAARHFQRSFSAVYGERHPHFVELGWQARLCPLLAVDCPFAIVSHGVYRAACFVRTARI